MFFKVTITLVLLVQISYQGKQLSKRNLMLIYKQSDDYFGTNKSRNGRQFKRMNKFFGNNDQIQPSGQTQKSRFFEVMSAIVNTPDYGLKFTEKKQSLFDLPGFPGFHNLIEVRGPTPQRYIPNKLKEHDVPRIHNQKKNTKTTYNSPELNELSKILNQLDEINISKEASMWDNSHELYKPIPGSDLLNKMQPSTPMLKYEECLQYISKVLTTTEVKTVEKETTTPYVASSFAAPDLFEKIDPLPYKQVKTRNQEDTDEDEDDERSKYLEDY